MSGTREDMIFRMDCKFQGLTEFNQPRYPSQTLSSARQPDKTVIDSWLQAIRSRLFQNFKEHLSITLIYHSRPYHKILFDSNQILSSTKVSQLLIYQKKVFNLKNISLHPHADHVSYTLFAKLSQKKRLPKLTFINVTIIVNK